MWGASANDEGRVESEDLDLKPVAEVPVPQPRLRHGLAQAEGFLRQNQNRLLIWGTAVFCLMALIAIVFALLQDAGSAFQGESPARFEREGANRESFEENWARSHRVEKQKRRR